MGVGGSVGISVGTWVSVGDGDGSMIGTAVGVAVGCAMVAVAVGTAGVIVGGTDCVGSNAPSVGVATKTCVAVGADVAVAAGAIGLFCCKINNAANPIR